MAKKYYAVRIGQTPGVYETWAECQAQTHGYPGAIFKSFPTKEEALEFVGDQNETSLTKPVPEVISEGKTQGQMPELPKIYAFTDGSFNIANGVYGYGGFLIVNGEKYILQGNGSDEEMSSMRNVAGEILGAQAAMEKALELGLKSLSIYYDYAGVEMWATGGWKTNKEGTRQYALKAKEYQQKIDITFVKVKGHSGIEGNEEADRLAKEAVGIE